MRQRKTGRAPAAAASTAAAHARFAAVVLDVDSTLVSIEGVDWLATRKGATAADEVAALTECAMAGTIPLDAVYGRRMAIVRPTRGDLEALAVAYEAALAPGAREAVRALLEAGVRVVLVSGGLRQAIAPLAVALGIGDDGLRAVGVTLAPDGSFTSFERTSPLVTHRGKLDVVRALGLPRPILGVGDGSTDIAMRPAVDAFAAFTGFVSRPAVVKKADHRLASFTELTTLVLGTPTATDA